MDRRTLIAFILALLVIIYYPNYLKKLYPPKQPVIKEGILLPEEKPKTPSEQTSSEQTLITSAPAIPEVPEEELTVTTPLVEVIFSNYEGTIKNIRLLQYHDKNNNPIELVRPLPVGYRPLATNLPQNTAAYAISRTENIITCTATSESLKITKIYLINPDSYAINVNLIIENTSPKEITLSNYNINVGTIFPGGESQANMYLGSTNLIDAKPVRTRLGNPGFRISHSGKVFWSGIKNKYFALILKPQTQAISVAVSDYGIDKIRGISNQITMPQVIIPKDRKNEESFLLYAGPKKYEILKSLGGKLDEIMDFGMLASISKLTLFILNFFYKLIHNYGVAIILLTILIRFILYPLTLKSYKSMREMHKLQPYIQELQKKYKDDPKRMQKEMMLLYKEHKVNPFSGCFPMLLQMPILIALFNTLRSAIELRGAPFMLWIKDLSEPDTLFKIQIAKQTLDQPAKFFSIHILPIFLIAAFFVQQKMTTMPATTEQQRQQQKMMSTIMPIFMGFIFYSMPSGLVLYFGLSTLLGIFDQYRIEKARQKGNTNYHE